MEDSGTLLNRFDASVAECPFATPEPITGLALPADSEEWGPALSADGSTLFFAVAVASGNQDLYQATRADRGSSFSAAAPLTALNTTSDEGTPFLSADGLTLYFYAVRAGAPGGRDIYFSTRPDLAAAFVDAELLGGVNSASRDHLPRLSADELTIIFTSDRPGAGGGDLWTATRADPSLAFDAPVPLTGMNTDASEESGALLGNGLGLLFDSKRPGGVGSNDIWTASRASLAAPFGNAVNASGLNSVRDEWNVMLSFDLGEIFFVSDRVELTNYHLWHALRACP